MKKINLIILSAVALIGFSSCNIEREPYGSMSSDVITEDPETNLSVVMSGVYAQLKDWSYQMHIAGEFKSDNIMNRKATTDPFYEFISYSNTADNYRLEYCWNYPYKAIAQSSNVISMIEEGQSDEVDQELGEAYFVRGMAYFYLCRLFARPYYDSPETNLGVPIVNGTPDDILNVELPDRSTVAEVYAQVIADLEKGAELMTIEKSAIYGSKGAAYALLSRVYLYMTGTWTSPNTTYAQKCVDYCEKTIAEGYTLLSYENMKVYNTFTPENNTETIFAVKRVASEYTGYAHYYGIGSYYGIVGGMGWGAVHPSAKYLALLDEAGRNDWYNDKIVDARAQFIQPQYSPLDYKVFRFVGKLNDASGTQTGYVSVQAEVSADSSYCTYSDVVYPLTAVDAENGVYTIEYLGETCQGVIDEYISENLGYPVIYNTKCSREGEESHLHSPVITRLAEIYLNMAEAKAKMGDLTGACTALNVVRERSLPGQAYSELTSENYVELIDNERQLELAFQAERGFDIFRNGQSLEKAYPGYHDSMQTIAPDDWRAIYLIPQDAINAYAPNTLTQNPTSN